jgi:hypothetical protein
MTPGNRVAETCSYHGPQLLRGGGGKGHLQLSSRWVVFGFVSTGLALWDKNAELLMINGVVFVF